MRACLNADSQNWHKIRKGTYAHMAFPSVRYGDEPAALDQALYCQQRSRLRSMLGVSWGRRACLCLLLGQKELSFRKTVFLKLDPSGKDITHATWQCWGFVHAPTGGEACWRKPVQQAHLLWSAGRSPRRTGPRRLQT